jgi:hypothetical protein
MIQKRMRTVTLAWVAATAGSALLTGQQAGSPAAIQHRQHIVAREKWQMSGRRIPGMNSAGLRNRAIQQKIQMRAARTISAAAVGLGGSWVSLGPHPLPSDASGIGLQDYGWVSGRATAVAIDPNDTSGNTVYAGGAYAGVWKSTNAGALSPVQPPCGWDRYGCRRTRFPSQIAHCRFQSFATIAKQYQCRAWKHGNTRFDVGFCVGLIHRFRDAHVLGSAAGCELSVPAI